MSTLKMSEESITRVTRIAAPSYFKVNLWATWIMGGSGADPVLLLFDSPRGRGLVSTIIKVIYTAARTYPNLRLR